MLKISTTKEIESGIWKCVTLRDKTFQDRKSTFLFQSLSVLTQGFRVVPSHTTPSDISAIILRRAKDEKVESVAPERPETVANCARNYHAATVNRLIASFFCPQEHVNLVGKDGENGPVLVSVKAETVAGQEHWRVLLRLRSASTHDLVPATNLTSSPTPSKMVKVKLFTRDNNENST